MLSRRWRRRVRDLREEWGRVLLMALAVAVSLMAVVAILGSYAILTREIRVSYLGTHPASATLELEGNVDGELAEEVRHWPGISDAPAADAGPPRAPAGGDLPPPLPLL